MLFGLGLPEWLTIIGLVGGLMLTFWVMARASVAYERKRQQRADGAAPGSTPGEGERTAPRPSVGGQAVLEGVMMRGPISWSVACRKPDETIAVESHPLPSLAERHPWLKWPLARGCLVLGESLAIGIKALMISANQALEDEEQLSDKQLGWTLASAMVLFSTVFIVL